MRTLVIGDIHGCLTALNNLLEMIDLQPDDQLITLGDYIDRGPDSKGAIDRLISIHQTGQLIPLKGNHEQMMLNARGEKFEISSWVTYFGKETMLSYDKNGGNNAELIPESHWNFIENDCLNGWENDHHIFVHANLDPDLPLERQSEHTLFWEKFWNAQRHYSGKTMVCGHTTQKDGFPRNLGYAICIDTWVYGEGWLTCLDTNSGQIWQANQQGQRRRTHINQQH